MTIDTAKMRAETLALIDGISDLWCIADGDIWTQINDPVETTYDIGYPVARIEGWKSVWNRQRWTGEQIASHARLIAAAPTLAADNLRLLDEIDRLTAENERLRAERDAAWKAGAEAMREAAANVASNACLVPPDGGSPTEEERLVCEEAWRRIRALPLPDQPKED